MEKRYLVYISDISDGTTEEWSLDQDSCSSREEWDDALFWAYHASGGRYHWRKSDSPVGEVETYHSLKEWSENEWSGRKTI